MNKIIKTPLKFLDSLGDRIAAVFGAVIFLQIPQFISHYIQRLGGHADEAGRNVEAYRTTAATIGKTLETYLNYLLKSTDSVIVETGKKIAADLERYKELQAAVKELSEASIYSKFFLFIKHLDLSIFNKTWENFTPGVPATLEGAVYALVGIVAAMLLYFIIKKSISGIYNKLTGKNKDNPVSTVP